VRHALASYTFILNQQHACPCVPISRSTPRHAARISQSCIVKPNHPGTRRWTNIAATKAELSTRPSLATLAGQGRYFEFEFIVTINPSFG